MCRAADNHNYMCHIYAKGFLDSNLNKLLKKYQIFKKLTQISHINEKAYFKSIIGTF